jgi:hypothetical protein
VLKLNYFHTGFTWKTQTKIGQQYPLVGSNVGPPWLYQQKFPVTFLSHFRQIQQQNYEGLVYAQRASRSFSLYDCFHRIVNLFRESLSQVNSTVRNGLPNSTLVTMTQWVRNRVHFEIH